MIFINSNFFDELNDFYSGKWTNPSTGLRFKPQYRCEIFGIHGVQADLCELLKSRNIPEPVCIVCDKNTYHALAKHLYECLAVELKITLVILDAPQPNNESIKQLMLSCKDIKSIVCVGTGTLNDISKMAAFRLNIPYCVFPTAASMNGFTSITASLQDDRGLKTSQQAIPPILCVVDFATCVHAPGYLNASGFADSICRSTSQIDQLLSHYLFLEPYQSSVFELSAKDEKIVIDMILRDKYDYKTWLAYLFKLLLWYGCGTQLMGTSAHGSMGEHSIVHYIDSFLSKYDKVLHGQKVGIATLTMATLQSDIFSYLSAPTLVNFMEPKCKNIVISEHLRSELISKPYYKNGIHSFQERLNYIWPKLTSIVKTKMIPAKLIASYLQKLGVSLSCEQIGLTSIEYLDVVRNSHLVRKRLSTLDLAAHSYFPLIDDTKDGWFSNWLNRKMKQAEAGF